MEVHKHPHHVMHKKKWSEYLLEFFMLFLAVFLGFLAENLRERIVENERAKEYAHSLVQDLKNDISFAKRYYGINRIASSYLDSLSDIIGQERVRQTKGGLLYLYGRFANGGLQVLWSNTTYDQLKNSGSLRYFRDVNLIRKISQYYAKTKEIDSKYEADLTRMSAATDLRNRIYKPLYLKPFTKIFLSTTTAPADQRVVDSLVQIDLPLQTYDYTVLNPFANLCMTRKLNWELMNRDYQVALNMATELVALLEKKYKEGD